MQDIIMHNTDPVYRGVVKAVRETQPHLKGRAFDLEVEHVYKLIQQEGGEVLINLVEAEKH